MLMPPRAHLALPCADGVSGSADAFTAMTRSCSREIQHLDPGMFLAALVFLSFTTDTDLPAYSLLYNNIRSSSSWPLLSTDFAIRALTGFRLLTSPTAMC